MVKKYSGKKEKPMKNLNLKNSRILIVDDEQSNIDILTGLLEIKEYTNVQTTTDPRLVVEIFQETKPDILLLDLMMPHLNGFQVMEQLQANIPANTYFPVLVLTADVLPQTKLLALAGGAKDFLTKPFDLTEVDLRISNLLQTRLLHTQLQNQNEILEEKVKERTLELENNMKELEISKNKAEASDRLKTAFINNISHEIRTPLNGILGFASFLAEPDISEEEKEIFLDYLRDSSDRLVKTVTDYMDIAMLVSENIEVKPKRFNLLTLFNGIQQKYQKSCAEKNLELFLEIPDQSLNLELNSDETLVSKCLAQLMDNAVKFTQKGNITLGYSHKANQFEISVRDTGVGIAEEAQSLIFQSFSQEDSSNTRSYEGNGLGLSLVNGFARLLGGQVKLESEKGKGTEVVLILPAETKKRPEMAIA
ncbi:MAG: hypothetical protein C0397_15830 [Odoribacter sp.]|nr:hypothetical protein [Odoribacter sp.]